MEIKKLFFDCEFTGLHKNTELLSIGIVSDCGEEFYAEIKDFDKNSILDIDLEYINSVILKNMKYKNIHENFFIEKENYLHVIGTKEYVSIMLKSWISQFEDVEIWSDCLAYDWVLFNNLFHHAFLIPKNIYYIPFDICTLFKVFGVDPDISREEFVENWIDFPIEKHNALYDAKIIRLCYEKLTIGKIAK